MFDPNSLHQPSLDQQHMPSHSHTAIYSEKKDANKSAAPDFQFCYNPNVNQKMAQPVGNCMDRYDFNQSFGCNYTNTVVNQMQPTTTTLTYKCDVCGALFAHLSLLNHHKKDHEPLDEIELYTCELCNTSFTEACDLKAHKQGAHNIDIPIKMCTPDTTTGNESSEKKKFSKCDNCEDTQDESNSQTLTKGIQTSDESPVLQKGFYPVKKKKVATIAKCHKCNGSGVIVVENTIAETADKPYRCHICNNTFSRYSSLWSHRKLHSGEKPFKCDTCGLAFARSSSLKNHIRVHTGERPFKCDVCGMQFSQAPHLKNHERIHSGERPYECDVCNKTFARHSTLWNHRRIHTGEKPYRCEVCDSAFNQASHLKNHLKIHTGEKPFKCDICDLAFADRFALKRHRLIHEKYGQRPAQVNTGTSVPDTWTQSEGLASPNNIIGP